MDLTFEKMSISHLESIKNILSSDFDDFWNYEILKSELKCENSYFIIVKNADTSEIIGFGGIKIVLDEADLMNIVVKKTYRNNKIGTKILENILEYAKNNKIRNIHLEVNNKNIIAISLYKKLGFQEIAIRKKYYNNIEDALIMLIKY